MTLIDLQIYIIISSRATINVNKLSKKKSYFLVSHNNPIIVSERQAEWRRFHALFRRLEFTEFLQDMPWEIF